MHCSGWHAVLYFLLCGLAIRTLWLSKGCAGSGKIVYVYRPVLAEGCAAAQPCVGLGSGGGLPLPGFGVELAIKNMEYSALDDSKVSNSSNRA